MKFISIHSHKGGAGKTSLALMISKKHSLAGEKVCLVDLDFLGSGLDKLLKISYSRFSLEDYLVPPPNNTDLVTLDSIKSRFADSDLPEDRKIIDVVLNYNSNFTNQDSKQRTRILGLIGREGRQSIVRRAVERLLSDIEASGYETVIFDCHPGITFLSKSVLDICRERSSDCYNVFVTTLNRSHFYGTLETMNSLSREEEEHGFSRTMSALCVNKIDQNGITWSTLKSMCDTDYQIISNLRSTISNFEEEQLNKNIIWIKSLTPDTMSDGIGMAAKIPQPSNDEIGRTNTSVCRGILLDMGRS